MGSEMCIRDRDETGAYGENGHVLDIGIMLGVIRYEVVDVVIVTPPQERQTANVGRHDDADQSIKPVYVCDARVSSIMSCECHLVPKGTERDGRDHVRQCLPRSVGCWYRCVGEMEEDVGAYRKQHVPNTLAAVVPRMQCVHASVFDAFMKLFKCPGNVGFTLERRFGRRRFQHFHW